jgi:hypothetical protein
MSKQTAVEWFAEQDTKLTLLYLAGKIKEAELGIKKMDLFHKALAIEKQQIVDAFNEGNQSDWNNEIGNGGQQYYNETFNQIKNDDEQSN